LSNKHRNSNFKYRLRYLNIDVLAIERSGFEQERVYFSERKIRAPSLRVLNEGEPARRSPNLELGSRIPPSPHFRTSTGYSIYYDKF